LCMMLSVRNLSLPMVQVCFFSFIR
jgi:hypothetical protein